MPILARLKKGSFQLANKIEERKPEILNGLISNFPFDNRNGAFDGIRGIQTLQHLETGQNLIELMDMDWRQPDSWQSNSGMVWDEAFQAMKVTGYHNTWLKTPIVVETNKQYRISIEIFQEVAPNSGLYLGGLSNNELGERVTTNFDYSYAANANASNVLPLGTWVTFRVTRTGTGSITSNNSLTFNTIVGWTGNRTGLTGTLLTRYYHFGGLFNYSSGGVLYFRNPRIEVINADSSNAVITDDGVVVEPAVTNVISNPHIFSSGWSAYVNGNDGAFPTEFNAEGLNLINRRSWCGAAKGITLPSTGTYTLSVWVKLISRSQSSINVTLYTSGGGIGDTNVLADWSPQFIGKWQRISMTRTYTSTALTLYLISYGGTNGLGWEVTAQYAMPQIEAGSQMNHFVTGSHAATTIGITPELPSNVTVVFDYFYNGGASNTVISNAQFNSRWWGLYHNSSGALYTHEGTNGNSHSSSWVQTTNTWATIAISWNNTTQKYYANGNLLGSLATTGATTSANIPIMYLGWGWTRGFGKFKNLRIYNRQLSDAEVLKLSNSRGSLAADGTYYIENVIERPLGLASGAFYFPLSIDNKLIDSNIGGTDELGVLYEDRAAYCRTAVTTRLHFNLNELIGLAWNSDHTILYWKKPVGTSGGPSSFTGYSIESLGCNSNSVGGNYVWFGKNSGSNTLSGSSPTNITPAKYFGNWHLVAIRRLGATVSVITLGDLGNGDSGSPTKSVRTFTGPGTGTAYVTQYGYDLKLGGWDNNNNCNTYFRDMLVFKTALTDLEIETIYKNEMSLSAKSLFIQFEISDGISF